MFTLEMAVSTGAFAATLAGIGYVAFVVRQSGAERVVSPQRVQDLRERAPYDRLDNVLSKRP